MPFTFHQPTRIIFGEHKFDSLGQVASHFGRKIFLITTTKNDPHLGPLFKRAISLLEEEGLEVYHFDQVLPNPPIDVIEEGIRLLQAKGPFDLVLGLGGGSSIDTAKAIALLHDQENIDWPTLFKNYTNPFESYPPIGAPPLPLLSVPTTSGTGSQLTQAMIISDPKNNEKNCIFHNLIFSKVTIIDPVLMKTLPKYMTAITGFDAFSHAFESYFSALASPYTELLAQESMATIIEYLPKLLDQTDNLEYRSKLAYSDMLSGISLTNAAANIPHPLSEIIGGVCQTIPHGQCLASLYPSYIHHVLKTNPKKAATIARLFDKTLTLSDDESAAKRLPLHFNTWLNQLGIHRSLKTLGVTQEAFTLMLNAPLLDHLPWADRPYLEAMLKASY